MAEETCVPVTSGVRVQGSGFRENFVANFVDSKTLRFLPITRRNCHMWPCLKMVGLVRRTRRGRFGEPSLPYALRDNLCGSPRRFALPPSDALCEAGRANRPGEPLIRVVRVIRSKKVTPSFIPFPQAASVRPSEAPMNGFQERST